MSQDRAPPKAGGGACALRPGLGAWLAAGARRTRQARRSELARQAPSVLTSDTLTYDTKNELVTATGNVEISTGQRRLLADEVRYDQRTDKMFATGNVVLIQPNGDAIFGEEVEVTGDLREGFVQAVGMLLKDDSASPPTAPTRREGNVIEFEHAVYSPCPLCNEGKGGPLWQIKARRVVLDEQAETVTYRDARHGAVRRARSHTRPGSATRHPASRVSPAF